MAATLSRYWHTLRHLLPKQIVGRAWKMLPERSIRAVAVAPTRRAPGGPWCAPIARGSSLQGPADFAFLGESHAIVGPADWDNPEVEKLWRYNLHYFDDLNARDSLERGGWHGDLIGRWQDDNPVGVGTGWEPYPTSLRIVNWVKRYQVAQLLNDRALASLATQARVLRRRLEWHLLGNHLFANAKALIFAGTIFDGAEAAAWRHLGSRIALRELDEQVLADGGNFERSPMYHQIFTEDVLDLLSVDRRWPSTMPPELASRLRAVAPKMLAAARALTLGDGEIALFNDAAWGIAPTTAELDDYAERLGIAGRDGGASPGSVTIRDLPATGYVRIDAGDAAMVADVGPVGPDYLPGHAHADTLSFELALGVERIVVNGGTSRYGIGERRSYERSTRAHSTVDVAGQDSSEVWGGFRVARRAQPFDRVLKEHGDHVVLACSHDGYMRLPGRPVHRRQWRMARGALSIVDSVIPARDDAIARFILHPDVLIAPSANGAKWRLTTPTRSIGLHVVHGDARIIRGSFAPRFGNIIETNVLEVALRDGRGEVTVSWETGND